MQRLCNHNPLHAFGTCDTRLFQKISVPYHGWHQYFTPLSLVLNYENSKMQFENALSSFALRITFTYYCSFPFRISIVLIANPFVIPCMTPNTPVNGYLRVLSICQREPLGWWMLNNGKGFSKISKPTEWDSTYHLQFGFPLLFSIDENLVTGELSKW